MATGGETIDTDGGHTITTGYDSEPQTGTQKTYVKGGVSFVSSKGEGNAFHVLPEYQDISNQQTESVDLLLETFGLANKAKPFSLKPDFSDPWDAVKLFGKITKQIGDDATEQKTQSSSMEDYPNPGTKVGAVVNFGSSNSKKINDSTWIPTTEKATDTSPVYKAGFKF
ncbi:MAG: hypothetical protein IPJ81_16525 [Chitinophagaceae bacterium]|nr:hypothetical protein [Chitinophagaceae bacterium]